MYTKILSWKLKEARKMNGFTQKDVENETGIKQVDISRYETGENKPSIDNLAKLAEFYGVSVDWLLGIGSKERNPNYDNETSITSQKRII